MNCRKMPEGRGAEVKVIRRPPALSSLCVIKQGRTLGWSRRPRAILERIDKRWPAPKSPSSRELNRAATHEPFSAPDSEGASYLLQPTWLTDGEACSDTAHPCLSYPKQFRQTTCAWEDSAVWAAPHLRRKAGTWELPEPWQASPAFQ